MHALDEETLLQVFEGVERYEISLDELKAGIVVKRGKKNFNKLTLK